MKINSLSGSGRKSERNIPELSEVELKAGKVVDYISVPTAAHESGLSPSTIYKWIDMGALSARKFQGRIIVKRKDVTECLHRR